MILESVSWKKELAKHARILTAWKGKVHTKRGYFLIERGVFISAFIVRKLIENRKLTDRVRGRSFRCRSFKPFRPLSDRVIRFQGIAQLDREYDLSSPENFQLSLFDLSSEIMHSYVFVPEVNEEAEFESFFVNSYRERDDRVLRIDAEKYLQALRLVIADDVVSARVWKDAATGRIYSELK